MIDGFSEDLRGSTWLRTTRNISTTYPQFSNVNVVSDADYEDVGESLQHSSFNQCQIRVDVRLPVSYDDRSVCKRESITVVRIKHNFPQSAVQQKADIS